MRYRLFGRRAATAAVLTALSLAPAVVRADPPDGYVFHSYDRGLARAATSNKPVFLYFGREGCGYCDFTNKNAFADPAVRRGYQEHFELVYVDSESGRRLRLPTGERITERELGVRFKAFVTPVFVFLAADGEPILKRIGVQSADQLLSYHRYVSEGHYRSRTFEQFSSGDG
jgi:thioredoxin-related protein